MTKHQYLHLTHQITQLHGYIEYGFIIIVVLMGLLFMCTIGSLSK